MQWIKIAVLANGMRFADGSSGMSADTVISGGKMKESKEKRAEQTMKSDRNRRKYYGMERTKVNTYSANHKPDYTGSKERKHDESRCDQTDE